MGLGEFAHAVSETRIKNNNFHYKYLPFVSIQSIICLIPVYFSIHDIFELNKEISSLHLEDNHIFEILNELQHVDKSIIEDYKSISNEIVTLKEKIERLSLVN